jgi:UDP-N-acetylmuramoyl-tripeptide--D-alanyl-D-alanine ligase
MRWLQRSAGLDPMALELWKFDELVRAAGGRADGCPSVPLSGFSIDTRTLAGGDVFVALKDRRDGHEFVTAAFSRGAGAAMVSEVYAKQAGDGALIRVGDPLKGLEAAGRAARGRLDPQARVFAVTGSAGKTGTKEMLRLALAASGRVHASEKSYNNHWGVPLTLASMSADAQFGVFEIGMNHAGEITPLTRMVRPHVAIVTTVEPVHLEYFASVAAIAEAKAEIFLGLEPSGTAILNRDNAHFDLLASRAKEAGARVVSFGASDAADVRLLDHVSRLEGSEISARVFDREVSYYVGSPGAHIAINSLAVAAALSVGGVDLGAGLAAIREIRPGPGRGARTVLSIEGGELLLIDESYNANPASMRAALSQLGTVPRDKFGRRIAVLGDMLELGAEARTLHEALRDDIEASGIDVVFASGPNMAHLYEKLGGDGTGGWSESSEGLRAALLGALRPGDAVMIKGSLGSRMGILVEALKARLGDVSNAS